MIPCIGRVALVNKSNCRIIRCIVHNVQCHSIGIVYAQHNWIHSSLVGVAIDQLHQMLFTKIKQHLARLSCERKSSHSTWTRKRLVYRKSSSGPYTCISRYVRSSVGLLRCTCSKQLFVFFFTTPSFNENHFVPHRVWVSLLILPQSLVSKGIRPKALCGAEMCWQATLH